MMKFFNSFEFIDNWQGLEYKGTCKKEVLCDYDPQKLEHLEETLELVRTANQFQEQLMYDHPFGKSYFFHRHFTGVYILLMNSGYYEEGYRNHRTQ